MLIFRSTVFALGLWLSILLYVPLVAIGAMLPNRFQHLLLGSWSGWVIWWLALTCGLRHQVEGQENLPPGNAIVMSKHQSAWETIALQRYFPNPCWVLKRELLWIPVFGWGLALTRPIAIDRKAGRKAMKQVLQQGRQRLEDGRWVIIFPEGTRVAPGIRKRYNMGGALLAQKTGYPVVPVAHNAGSFWRRRGFIKYPGTIRLVIGPAIPTEGKRADEINAQVEHWVETTMERIAPVPAASGHPA